MALVKRAVAVFLVLLVALLQVSNAAVYKVGDSAGWTTIGNVDYKQWAATKTFHVGDIILFEYNAQFHNVMRVRHAEYKSCNSSAPLATYTTGNDSFTVSTQGHHYFFCGVTGHCQAGQKVDINVARASSIAPTSASPSPSPSAVVPGPSPNNTAPLNALKGLFSKLGLAIAVFAVYVSGFA